MKSHRYHGILGDKSAKPIWPALLISVVLHVGLMAAFGNFHIAREDRRFFAPMHMVSLVEEKSAANGPVKKTAKPVKKVKKKPPPPKPKPKPKAKPKPPPPIPEKGAAILEKAPEKAPPAPKPEPVTEETIAGRIAKMREKHGTDEENQREVSDSVEEIRRKVGESETTYGGASTAAPQLAGNRTILEQMRWRTYYQQIVDHVHKEWNLPPSLQGRGLVVIIGIAFDREGVVLHSKIEESSGNSVFDDSALKALHRASPMPPVPEEIPDEIFEVGFRLRRD